MHEWKNPQGTRVYEKHGGAVETAHDHKKQRWKRDKFITIDMICEKCEYHIMNATLLEGH